MTALPIYNGQRQAYTPKSEWMIVENTHEPLIDEETFDKVQVIAKQRHDEYHDRLAKYDDDIDLTENILKGLVCGKGAGDGLKCKTPHLTDNEIKAVFVGAMNAALANKQEILDSSRTAVQFLTDASGLEAELSALEAERAVAHH